jgi:hypothetical protein
MQTISWQRPSTSLEKTNLIKKGLICLGLGAFLTFVGYTDDKSSPVLGILLLTIGFYMLLKYLINPAARKNAEISDCSLTVLSTGFIYTKNTIKKFFFYKDLNKITSNEDNLILQIKGLVPEIPNVNGIVIPVKSLYPETTDTFLEKFMENLPAENKKISSYELIQQKVKKSSNLWVYLGFGIVLLVCLGLAATM